MTSPLKEGTPTPRTDAVWKSAFNFSDMTDLARQLERALTLSQAEAAGAHKIIKELQERCAELERERDLAIAHDRQPYPTAAAYEAVCEAHRHCHERIAELEKDAVRYRWLREHWTTDYPMCSVNWEMSSSRGAWSTEEVEAAIDAALSRKA